MRPFLYSSLALLFLCSISACQNNIEDPRYYANGETNKKAIQNIFGNKCGTCHLNNAGTLAPGVIHLGALSPRAIVSTLESGKMQMHGDSLSRKQKIALAELLTSRKFEEGKKPINYCNDRPWTDVSVLYSGWTGSPEGSAFIPSSVAQLNKEDVGKLKLKWAFGIDGGTVTRTKVSVIGDHILFGSQFGEIYCLEMTSGCVQWIFEGDAVIRGGLAISEDVNDRITVYAVDFGGNTYAINATDGTLLWKTRVKIDPNNAVTGSPAYHDNMVYVPLTSMEVETAGNDQYECCKSSGQVVAVNATTGEEVWRHRVIPEKATQRGTNKAGAKKFGPSGSPVWSSPSVDAQRGLLYIGTGENNSNPPTLDSDALQALDLKTGALKWNYQATPKDAYISACNTPDAANCPDPPGPDVDFGMAPILTTRADGRQVLVVGQKSGVVHCLDPESGQPIWQTRIGRGGALGGIHWGMATDGRRVYAANSDWWPYGAEPGVEANPGLFALDLMTGEIQWKSTSDPSICKGRKGCYNSNSSAPSMIPGVVFAGSLDGYLRAHNSEDGNVLWEFNTARSFETVNGVSSKGGSIDGPGPTIANGMVFINSGYALFEQMPGNVLLAFAIDEPPQK